MTARMIRIASAQYPIDQPATFEDWASKAGQWVAEGAATGAQLLMFPEYGAIELAATCGEKVYRDLQATLGAVADLVPRMEEVLIDLAREHDVHILAGSGPSRRADGRFTNSARLIAPHGYVGIQDKMIMTPFEVGWGVVPGETLKVFDTALGKIGIAICYDCEFPLLVRAQVEAGGRTDPDPVVHRAAGRFPSRARWCSRPRTRKPDRDCDVTDDRRCAMVTSRRPQHGRGRHLHPARSSDRRDRRVGRGSHQRTRLDFSHDRHDSARPHPQ